MTKKTNRETPSIFKQFGELIVFLTALYILISIFMEISKPTPHTVDLELLKNDWYFTESHNINGTKYIKFCRVIVSENRTDFDKECKIFSQEELEKVI